MDQLLLTPIDHVAGEVRLPGSKSLSNRALLLSSLATGTTRLHNLLHSDDTDRMLEAQRCRSGFFRRYFTVLIDIHSCEFHLHAGPVFCHSRLVFSDFLGLASLHFCHGNPTVLIDVGLGYPIFVPRLKLVQVDDASLARVHFIQHVLLKFIPCGKCGQG